MQLISSVLTTCAADHFRLLVQSESFQQCLPVFLVCLALRSLARSYECSTEDVQRLLVFAPASHAPAHLETASFAHLRIFFSSTPLPTNGSRRRVRPLSRLSQSGGMSLAPCRSILTVFQWQVDHTHKPCTHQPHFIFNFFCSMFFRIFPLNVFLLL